MSRDVRLLISMGAGFLLAALAFIAAAIADAPWIAVVGMVFIALALIQRERLIGFGGVVLLLIALAALLGFVVQRLAE